jgi:LysM repeat protein
MIKYLILLILIHISICGYSQFDQNWNNDKLYSFENIKKIVNIEDTIFLCINDTNTGKFIIPNGGYMTSRFGSRWGSSHNGVDIALKTGEPVRAAWNGTVRYSKLNGGGYGNIVVIRHNNGLETYYAHLSRLLVKPNQKVTAGDTIGLGGNTGYSFGAHLHFEIRYFDAPINPEYLIDFSSNKVVNDNVLICKNLFKTGWKNNLEIEYPVDKEYEFEPVEMVAGVAFGMLRDSNIYSNIEKTEKKEFRRYHKVKSGDNLSKIAYLNHTTVNEICKLNNLTTKSILRVGNFIRVR